MLTRTGVEPIASDEFTIEAPARFAISTLSAPVTSHDNITVVPKGTSTDSDAEKSLIVGAPSNVSETSSETIPTVFEAVIVNTVEASTWYMTAPVASVDVATSAPLVSVIITLSAPVTFQVNEIIAPGVIPSVCDAVNPLITGNAWTSTVTGVIPETVPPGPVALSVYVVVSSTVSVVDPFAACCASLVEKTSTLSEVLIVIDSASAVSQLSSTLSPAATASLSAVKR